MLNQTSISSAYPLASIIARAGKSLDAVPESALADLLATCEPATEAWHDENSESTPVAIDAQVAQSALAESVPGVNDHDLEVERIAQLASKAVAFTLDMARNVVNPKVAQVVDATERHIEAYRRKRGEPLTIAPVFLGTVYESASLADLASRFKDAPVTNVPAVQLTLTWPEGGLSEALDSGVSDLDASVQAHFAGREDEVKSLWQKFFADEPGVYRDGDLFSAIPNMDDALVVFLASRALLVGDVVPEGLKISLHAYRAYLARLEEQAAARLAFQLRTAQTSARSSQLVISAPPKPQRGQLLAGVIKVNGEVYNRWLDEGGSPEALFGAVATGTAMQYHVILGQAESLAASWTRSMRLVEQQLQFERHTAAIQGLSAALSKLAAELPENERRTDVGALQAAIAERLSHFHVKDLDNLYLVARKAVCRVFYPHTDAEKILNAMDAVVADQPDLDPREAALLVMIDYVTDWVGSSITVDNVVADSRS